MLPWLIPVLIALGAVALLALAWWLWKKRKKAATIETIVPELPPEMTAMRALDGISDVRRLDGKTFYFRLSAILRQYVFGRFAVGAPEMTTEEFLPCIDRIRDGQRPGPTAQEPVPEHGSGEVRR
jgi:LPXTG-motif cell wall-anchored protein